MKTPLNNINEIFEFKGLWDMPSKCGLKILKQNEKYFVIVSELYQDNPGTSITQASYVLAKQICEKYGFSMEEIVYIEHNPDMDSKLSFYDEQYFQVSFNDTLQASYRKLSKEEIEFLLTSIL